MLTHIYRVWLSSSVSIALMHSGTGSGKTKIILIVPNYIFLFYYWMLNIDASQHGRKQLIRGAIQQKGMFFSFTDGFVGAVLAPSYLSLLYASQASPKPVCEGKHSPGQVGRPDVVCVSSIALCLHKHHVHLNDTVNRAAAVVGLYYTWLNSILV